MDVSLSEEIKWRYYCTSSAVEQLKYKEMILNRRSVSDGYEITLNVAGSKKEDVVVTAKPDGELKILVKENEYFSERVFRWVAGALYDSLKTKVKFEYGLLVITIPYKDKMHDVEIKVD